MNSLFTTRESPLRLRNSTPNATNMQDAGTGQRGFAHVRVGTEYDFT